MTDTVTAVCLPHRSPGLTAIYNEIKGSRVNHVLDLGPSSAKSFNFFAQLSCKIRFENLNELFANEGEEVSGGEGQIALLKRYLDVAKLQDRFDVVLTWDLFNYLDLDGVDWLMQQLGPLCRSDALIHSVRYLGANIPACPQDFQIVNQYQVLIAQSAETASRRHPSHDTARLLRLMPNFYLENHYLNLDGMVPGLIENVFRFQPEKSLSGRRQSSEELANTETLYVGGLHVSGPPPQARQCHRSPALAGVLEQISRSSQPAILDLGLKNRQNLDFLHGITQNIYAENLYQELLLQGKAGQEPQFKAHMLNFPDSLRFDVVLLWDTLNFLSPATIEELFCRLRPWMHDATVVHAIVYSGKEIPAAPQTFFICNASELTIVAGDKRPATEPLTSSRLLKLMKTFRLSDTFVFRPGMQRGIYEYLFCPLSQISKKIC